MKDENGDTVVEDDAEEPEKPAAKTTKSSTAKPKS
jgi:hypothetical protein